MAEENLEGTATDANGNPLSNVRVAAFLTDFGGADSNTKEVKYTTTDANGNY